MKKTAREERIWEKKKDLELAETDCWVNLDSQGVTHCSLKVMLLSGYVTAFVSFSLK